MEDLLQVWQNSLRKPDQAAREAAQRQWDSIAKPLGSLGALEKLVMDIAALTGDPAVDISQRAVVVCCADNGVVREGVTQTGQEVTARMAAEMVKMGSSVCRMARTAHADVIPVDLGMVRRVEGVLDRHVMDGTEDMARRPAMTREQAMEAISAGVDLVKDLKAQGYGLLVSGEMGIGNTTTSSALVAALLNLPAETVTGRGAGLSDAGLHRKIWAIERARAGGHRRVHQRRGGPDGPAALPRGRRGHAAQPLFRRTGGQASADGFE